MRSIHLLQTIYIVVGLAFNVVSLDRIARLRQPLAPTRPGSAIFFFGTYAVAMAFLSLGGHTTYRLMMLAIAALLLTGGIAPHLKNGPSSKYASSLAWFSAIAINTFGLVVTVGGAIAG